MAVYNHYQRLRHEDNLAAARKEREEGARVDAAEVEQPAEAVLHPDHLPYPPTSDLRKVMADRQRFTRSLFDEETRYLACLLLGSLCMAELHCQRPAQLLLSGPAGPVDSAN